MVVSRRFPQILPGTGSVVTVRIGTMDACTSSVARAELSGATSIAAGLLATVGLAYSFPTASSATVATRQGQQQQSSQSSTSTTISSTGLSPGAVKHVWLIILENKSYDATFTGLNQNTYLWKTLPAQGALLTHYYGTGHSSMDNYMSMVSGQAPSEDVQQDCSTTNTLLNSNSGIVTSGGSLSSNPNYGQLVSKGGANAPLGTNGCTLPDQRSRRCSTSSMRPGRPGRTTPRTSAARRTTCRTRTRPSRGDRARA